MTTGKTSKRPGKMKGGGRTKEPLELPPVDQALKVEVHSLSLLRIEGIGAVHVERLARAGIKSLQSLFNRGRTPKGRREIAAESGIDERIILNWVNRADLMRLHGIGEEYADLLEQAGVDTPVELAHRVPENLYRKLVEENQNKKITRRTPSLKQVSAWVQEAKKLPRVVTY